LAKFGLFIFFGPGKPVQQTNLIAGRALNRQPLNEFGIHQREREREMNWN